MIDREVKLISLDDATFHFSGEPGRLINCLIQKGFDLADVFHRPVELHSSSLIRHAEVLNPRDKFGAETWDLASVKPILYIEHEKKCT